MHYIPDQNLIQKFYLYLIIYEEGNQGKISPFTVLQYKVSRIKSHYQNEFATIDQNLRIWLIIWAAVNYYIIRGDFSGVKIAVETQDSIHFIKRHWLKGIVANV